MTIDVLAKTVMSAVREGLFRKTPVFEAYKAVSPSELLALSEKIDAPIPEALRAWLLALGYGDINDELSFREAWFSRIESGQLKGGTIFAQDILGDFYALDSRGGIYYLSRSRPGFAMMSEDFSGFIEELVRRNYQLLAWTKTLKTGKYDW